MEGEPLGGFPVTSQGQSAQQERQKWMLHRRSPKLQCGFGGWEVCKTTVPVSFMRKSAGPFGYGKMPGANLDDCPN